MLCINRDFRTCGNQYFPQISLPLFSSLFRAAKPLKRVFVGAGDQSSSRHHLPLSHLTGAPHRTPEILRVFTSSGHDEVLIQDLSVCQYCLYVQLVENLADAIESGTRDQQSDALVNELTSHFDKCQQLLNSISGSINTKAMTVEGQKRKLEETEQLLNQRRDLISKYRSSVEDLIKSDR
ncbi:hypothetical protein HHK36_014308 [Tetracentron sinense]|uniref:Mediator of RNA polymerase II transcription subunit 9 n=1 Tax=Tetracentron sinense TaxID=13715 RepID=A0A834Z7Y1_TETSI|nr:hypothetical protein HHK36_014308 [Tetracentron sinense]